MEINTLTDIFHNPGFMPHVHCYLGQTSLTWTMVITNLAIGLSYFAISLMLIRLVRKVKVPFTPIVLCFGLFIAACGATHLMEVWTLWHPDYWIDASVKVLTAFASVGTAVYLNDLNKPIVQLAKTAQESNSVRERLEQLTNELENHVKERNRALENLNERFSRVSSATDLGVWYCDLPFDVLNWNEKTKEHFWLSHDATVTIQDFYERIHPDDREKTRLAIARSIDEKVPYNTEYRTLSPDKKNVKWIRAIGWTDYDETGKPIKFDGITLDITAQRFASERLKESEKRFRRMADTMPQVVWMATLDGRFVYASKKWHDFTGLTENETMDSRWMTAIHPDDASETLRLWKVALEGLTNSETHFRLRGRDGNYRHHLFKGIPVKSEGGEFLYWLGTMTDIHDFKQNQERLRLTEERLNITIESSDIGVWDWNVKQDNVYLSDSFIKKWEMDSTKDQYSKQDCMNQIHPDDRALVDAEIARCVQENKPYDAEFRVVKSDGSIIWINSKGKAFFGNDGSFERLTGISIDITEKRKAAEVLAESEDRFRTMANSIPQMACTADAEGNAIWYNKRWREYTGIDPDELMGWGWQKVHHPDHVEQIKARWKHSLATKQPFAMKTPIRGCDGRYRMFMTIANPVLDQAGNVMLWTATNSDINDLQIIQENLEEAVRARDEFLSLASHELKTPLTSLKLQSQIFKRSVQKGDPRPYEKERVDGIVEETDKQTSRLTRLVDDMLDVARIRSGKLSIERENFDLCELISETIDRLQSQFGSLGKSVPVFNMDCRAIGFWDRTRIEQILTNLLTNAVRYGEGKPVFVSVEDRKENYIISVKDQGIGIAKEAQEKIFERFERAVNANEVSGLGLGLFIAKKIVLAHGGSIWVESEPNKGSTFFVSLPKSPNTKSQEAVNVL